MAMLPRRLHQDAYTVAWICSLEVEQTAASHMLDEKHEALPQFPGDHNVYTLGSVNDHNIIIANLGQPNSHSTAKGFSQMVRTFFAIRSVLSVGIGGGVPQKTDNGLVRLGHVVVSKPTTTHAGILQYDTERAMAGHFEQTCALAPPTAVILSAMDALAARRAEMDEDPVWKDTQRVKVDGPEIRRFDFPGVSNDRLYSPNEIHQEAGMSCEMAGCSQDQLIERRVEKDHNSFVVVHRGTIASGELVVKNASLRDILAKQSEILCFDIQAAGIPPQVPCLVIRGISNYCDTHSNDDWHGYAAVAAAAYARQLLFGLSDRIRGNAGIPTTRYIVPYTMSPNFVGRSMILENLKRQLDPERSIHGGFQTRISLYGLGGVGKTQIALAYVHWLHEHYPTTSIFWVNASNPDHFRESYALIARECQIPGYDDPGINVLVLVKEWLENEVDERWLMVVDNAENIDFADRQPGSFATHSTDPSNGATFAPYLPECAYGDILITTRNRHDAVKLSKHRQTIEVSRMDEDESHHLLRKILEGVNASSDDLMKLSSQLGHLPLALSQASSFIQKQCVTVAEYIQLLKENENSWALLSEPIEAVGRDPETLNSVVSTWTVSLEQIEVQNAFSIELISFMSILDCQDIPEKLLSHYWERRLAVRPESDAPGLLTALEILKAFSFVTENTSRGFDIHRLVQLVTREWLTKRGSIGRVRRDALMAVSFMFPYGSFDTREVCAKMIPHANSVLELDGALSKDEAKARASLLYCMAGFYDLEGKNDLAETSSLEAVRISEEIQGAGHPSTLTMKRSAASIYLSQGRITEAENILVKVVDMSMDSLGADHSDTLTSMDKLGFTYTKQERWEDAEQILLRVLETWGVLGGEHLQLPSSIKLLAELYRDQGRWEKAESLEAKISTTAQTVMRAEYQSRSFSKSPMRSDRDSGYVSASRTAILQVPSKLLLEDVNQSAATERYHGVDRTLEEIQSIASDEDDIGSEASGQTTNEGMAGKALIRVFLTKQPCIRSLCEKALATLSRRRFLKTIRKLLRSFYKSLSEEAEDEAQRAIAGLLRSRRGRLRIGEQLAAYIVQEEEAWASDRVKNDIDEVDKYPVEMWLARLSGKAEGPPPKPDELDVDNAASEASSHGESSSSNSDDEFPSGHFPFISELEAFLQNSKSLQRLHENFMLFFLPFELRNVLLSIPRKHIWVSQEQDVSLLNRAKAWVEDSTQAKWNWWPLSPRKRVVQNGQERVFWKCTCGAERWQDVSIEQSDLVRKIITYPQEHNKPTYWCKRKGKGGLFSTWSGGVLWRTLCAPAQLASSAAQQYTPHWSVGSTPSLRYQSSTHGNVVPGCGQSPSQPDHHQPSATGQQTRVPVSYTLAQPESWILFGVQGASRTLSLSQIPVHNQATHCSIFEDMRKFYRLRRGWLRFWFSVWELEYCESVKFQRLGIDRMVRDRRELPIQQDYQYKPRAPEADALNPPIDSHLFQALFYSCTSPCTRLVPHECIPRPNGNTFLDRIPKRFQSFERDLDSPIWGLEAVLTVSTHRVLAYHCIMVAGPVIFWGYWLKTHPDDVQSASVLVTVVIGGLSLFWSGAGILTTKDHR